MALHTKWTHLAALLPDIAIVAECAAPDILWMRRKTGPECDVQWVGGNQHKGLGVFAFSGFSIKRDETYDPRFKHFLPVIVSGETNFSLLAVWAFNGRTKPAPSSYGPATIAAIDYYEPFLSSKNSVIAGDFNNSIIWDRNGRPHNFSSITTRLSELGLSSAYHKANNSNFGSETDPTLFYRKGPSEYHIDYCFLPDKWTADKVVIGSREQWIGVSDHAPLVVTCTVGAVPEQ